MVRSIFVIISFFLLFGSVFCDIYQIEPLPHVEAYFDEPFRVNISAKSFFSNTSEITFQFDNWINIFFDDQIKLIQVLQIGPVKSDIYDVTAYNGLVWIADLSHDTMNTLDCRTNSRCKQVIGTTIVLGANARYINPIPETNMIVVSGYAAKILNYTSDFQVISGVSNISLSGLYCPDAFDNILYCISGPQLHLYNIEDPRNPYLISSLPVSSREVEAVPSINTVVTVGSTIRTFNISNKTQPVINSGSYGLNNGIRVAVRARDQVAFVADLVVGLRIFDISNPNSFTEIGSVLGSGSWLHDISLANDENWVVVFGNRPGTGVRGVSVYDVTNPRQPKYVYFHPSYNNYGVYTGDADRNLIFLGSGWDYVSVFEWGGVTIEGTIRREDNGLGFVCGAGNIINFTVSHELEAYLNVTMKARGYAGDSCSTPICFGKWENQTVNTTDNDPNNDFLPCHGHGECVLPNNCSCYVGYWEEECNRWSCYDIDKDNLLVCSGHGVCSSLNNCSCEEKYNSVSDCSKWDCWGLPLTHDEVCGGHGTCVGVDECKCQPGYFSSKYEGRECDSWRCGLFSVSTNSSFESDPEICNGRGECVKTDECTCSGEFSGKLCESWSCYGYEYDHPLACSGNGVCSEPDNCEGCRGSYFGEKCDNNLLYYVVLAPSVLIVGCVGVFLVLFLVCLCFSVCVIGIVLFCCVIAMLFFAVFLLLCCVASLFCFVSLQRFRLKKFGKLKNFDILMHEQKMEDDVSIAHLKITKSLFEVDYEEIKVDTILGEGGSNSVVYKAKWKGQIVAFKCFKTRTICSNQNMFDEFEREVQVMSSVSHPNIIRFFGATLNPPRVGIIMEFAENGEIHQFVLRTYREEKKKIYPFSEKCRLFTAICAGFEYLHKRQIIHRDLKCENILLDQKESPKIMDFGLSKLVERISQAKTTRIGTDVYMSPEIVHSSTYDERCDVYSFSMIIYILLTEDLYPYGNNAFGVELKVANDPTFRPDISKLFALYDQKKDELEYVPKRSVRKWIEKIVTNCWDGDYTKRKRFSNLREEFEGISEFVKEDMGKERDLGSSSDEEDEEVVVVEKKDEKEIMRLELEKLKREVEELKEKNSGLENENSKLKDEIGRYKGSEKREEETTTTSSSSESEDSSDE